MSAYIVSRNHIAFLVDAAMSRRIMPSYHGPLSWVWDVDRKTSNYKRATLACTGNTEATRVGAMLWAENVKSVQYRYPDSEGALPGPVDCDSEYKRHTSRPQPGLEPVAVLKAISGYRYQSCEHDEWEASEAFAFCSSLEHAAIAALPGWDDAEWAIS